MRREVESEDQRAAEELKMQMVDTWHKPSKTTASMVESVMDILGFYFAFFCLFYFLGGGRGGGGTVLIQNVKH